MKQNLSASSAQGDFVVILLRKQDRPLHRIALLLNVLFLARTLAFAVCEQTVRIVNELIDNNVFAL